ncbi:long-chain-alcohol O-fatty-acyltransferase-like [Magnolia sinica]|uniref:long-chain-alcohol O-fatty-acyltransferase-like n=1 Tax=Magnolia sinica TaxID=86752 RepID=UPI002658308C|nr:long-chain-alcohol O-fatty-acyltransferase-like [Magnolia sinica]
MEDEIRNLLRALFLVITSLSYCYLIVAKLPKGKARLISLLPVFYLFYTIPWIFSSVTLRAITAFYFTWVSNFKLLMLSFDKGPLSSHHMSMFSFITIAAFPIQIKEGPPPQHHKTPPKPSLNLKSLIPIALKVLFSVGLVTLFPHMRETFPNFILVLYCMHIFLVIDLVVVGSANLARTMVGRELQPQFDKPHLSTSLQNFWGRRWNLIATYILRPTVYNPILSTLTRFVDVLLAKMVAVPTTFLVSGLIHELILYYMTDGEEPSWEITCFFVLHGCCTAMEILVKEAVGVKYRWRPVISSSLTLGFVVATAMWLLIPPFLKSGIDVKGIEEYTTFLMFLAKKQEALQLVLKKHVKLF